MHGIYTNSDDNIRGFLKSLIDFAMNIDYSNEKEKCEPFKKYVKLGFEKSIAYTYTIDEIEKNVSIKKLSFLRDDPQFTFRIAFTDNPNPSNALWANEKNRITIIIKSDYTNLNKDIQSLKSNKNIIGSLSHELVHAFDYSKTPKKQLDKNKSELYHKAKKEMSLGKEYTTCKMDISKILTDTKEIIKFYHVILYYAQQTEMNAYLRTFQNEVNEKNENDKITDIDIYRRYKFLNKFLDSYEKYDDKDKIIQFLKSSSYPLCFGKVNKVFNASNISSNDVLKKINFIINRNYIQYNMNRMQKLYSDIQNGEMNEKNLNNIENFDTFLYNISEEIEL